jgi:hypothetical protein
MAGDRVFEVLEEKLVVLGYPVVEREEVRILLA